MIELLSLLDIKHVEGAVFVKDEDLVEVAYLVQHGHERAAIKFTQMINDGRLVAFFSALDSPIPLGSMVEAIVLENEVVCKKLN